jgi:hypothetical protein
MREIILFAEDYGHEAIISALLERLARENMEDITVTNRSVRGGHGKAVSEFRAFLREIAREREPLPDLIVVVIDANCKGYTQRRREIDEASELFEGFVMYAIPDPHIERWLLLDSSAFKYVFGKGCDAPDRKCERDRYKRLLSEAIQATGIVPPLGGIEYAEDIIDAMDLEQMEQANASFGRFLKDLGNVFKRWAK